MGPVGSVHHGCASQGAIDSPGVKERQGALDINVESVVVYYRALPSRTIKIHKKKKIIIIIKRKIRVVEWLNEPGERRESLQEVSRSGERQHLVL